MRALHPPDSDGSSSGPPRRLERLLGSLRPGLEAARRLTARREKERVGPSSDVPHRLSGEDAGYLYLERPGQTLNVLGVAVMSSSHAAAPITLDNLRRHMAGLLDRLPFLRWRVVPVPWQLHHPVYVEDPDFDLRRHVVEATLPPPGDDFDLDRFLAALAARPFDRQWPLWQMVLVHGLADGCQVVVSRLHHCYLDGQAAAAAFAIVFDSARGAGGTGAADGSGAPGATHRADGDGSATDEGDRTRHIIRRVPSALGLVTDALTDQARSLRRLPRLVWATVNALARLRRAEGEMGGAGSPRRRPPADAPRTVSAEAVGSELVTARVSMSCEDLAEVRARVGVSPNDVMLAVVAGALRAYLGERGSLPARSLTTSVPVALRWPDDGRRVHGNHIFGLSVPLAIDIADPIERLRAISTASSKAKTMLKSANPELWWTWLDVIPPFVARWAIARGSLHARQHPDQVAHKLLLSNFAGPAEPWDLLGTRCEEWYWYGPPNQGVSLNLSVWTYAGRAYMGIEALSTAVADPVALAGSLSRSLDELVAAARAQGSAGPTEPSPRTTTR